MNSKGLKKQIGYFLKLVGMYNVVRGIMRPVMMFVNLFPAFLFYKRFMRKGDLVFDVGANCGSRTRIFRLLGALVVSIEPLNQNIMILQRRFGKDPNVEVVPMGLADEKGEKKIRYTNNATDVASMSNDWIDVAKKLDCLSDERFKWDKYEIVDVTTLDILINTYGMPVFCKIDVEGFEPDVLRGLSMPIPGLSFEFTPGCIERSIDCVKHLISLGDYVFNYSHGQTMKLAQDEWVDSKGMINILKSFTDETLPGDIYAVL